MKKLLAALLLVAAPAFAQTNGWQEIQNGWSEIQTPPGYSTIPAPTGCASGLVPYFNSSLQLVCSPTVYAPATDTTTAGTIVARNLTASGLATSAITSPLTVNGTPGVTTYGYKLTARAADSTTTAASAEVTIATGNATLDGTNNITVAWPAVTGAATYKLYRTTGGAAPPKLIYTGTALSFTDIGAAGTAETPATVDGTGVVAGGTLSATAQGDNKFWKGLDLPIGITGAGAFGISLDTMPEFGGVPDPTMYLGYNMGSSNASADGVNPAFGWTWESNYQVGGQRILELYSTLYNPSTVFGTRPWMITYNTVTNDVTSTFTGAQAQFAKTYGAQATAWIAPGQAPRFGAYADGGGDSPFFESTNYNSSVGRNIGLSVRKARGTFASKTAIANGDYIGYNTWSAWDGTYWTIAAYDDVQVAGAVSAGVVPGRRVFNVANSVGAFIRPLELTATDVTATVPVTATQYKLSALNTAPATAASTGTLGEIRITADSIYVCIATDTWVKADLAAW